MANYMIIPDSYCRFCSHEKFPGQSDISVERGDVDYWVTLDGEAISNDCIQATRGNPGSVVLNRREDGGLGLCSICAARQVSMVALVVKTGVVDYGPMEVNSG